MRERIQRELEKARHDYRSAERNIAYYERLLSRMDNHKSEGK